MGLILTRRIGEEVIIGGAVTVRLLDLGMGQATLAFDAPREIVVDRGEVHLQKQMAEQIKQAKGWQSKDAIAKQPG